jgi:DnaJ-class molecular chaperone
MSENYYNILGVNEKSTKEEIKKAYRSLQMKYHPDKNPGNKDSMNLTQKINEAYEVLGDEQKRDEYDMTRNNPFMKMNNPFANGMGANGMGANGMGANGMDSQMEDIISMFFGGGGMPFGGMPGMPPGAKIHIFQGGPPMNFQQAMNKPIPIMKSVQINMEQVFNGGSIPMEIERWILENGTKVFEKETIYIDIPQGIDDNEMIILRDRGNIISDQCKGDIKVNILVQNNTYFKRSGLDLILDKTISLKDALCGFTFEINYLNGKNYTLNNSKGSIVQPEYKKLYTGMGLKRGEHKGNMIINFHIEFPEKLTEEQIDKLSKIL